jgi:UPF0176 protein
MVWSHTLHLRGFMHYITAYYHFTPIENTELTKQKITEIAQQTGTLGLIILAKEGINSTVSNKSAEGLAIYKQKLLQYFNLEKMNFKDSESDVRPFRRLSIKLREEIVTTGRNDLKVRKNKNHHLSPDEWNKVIQNEKPVIIDTRNWYEYKIGTFKGAVNPNTEKFTDFPQYMNTQNIDKNQKILIFCTGGIRCEKGILELQDKGYSNIYQLDGGILNYIKEKPNDQFEGECFVFDHRVAVDQNLKPSTQYKLCPHCGQPGKIVIDCKRCDTPQEICEDCIQLDWKKDTCSKNCAHHYKLHPDRKAQRQVLPYELEE